MSEYPFPATVVVVDLKSFSTLTNPEQIAARKQLYDLLSGAFTAGGVDWDLCAHEDRGDGVMVIVPSEVPKAVLLGAVVIEFARRVESAPRLPSGWVCQTRLAIHTGEVHEDGKGYVGSDVNHAFRLVDSEALRDALSTSERRCAVMVSDVLYQSIVRHGYGEIDANAFHRTVVHVKDVVATAWMSVPGDDATARDVAARQRGPQRQPNAQTVVGGNMTVTGSTFAGRDMHVGDHVKGDKVGRDKITNQTFVQQVRRHPVAAALAVLLLLGGAGWAGYGLLGGNTGAATSTGDITNGNSTPPTGGAPDPTAGQPVLDPGLAVGSWQPSDKTDTKSFSGNGGACEGFFYNQGAPLDIGGPMTCTISSQPDPNGRYTLRVTQKPNQASYKIRFDSSDQATVFSSSGTEMYRISRF